MRVPADELDGWLKRKNRIGELPWLRIISRRAWAIVLPAHLHAAADLRPMTKAALQKRELS
jgi:hypothetical protein